MMLRKLQGQLQVTTFSGPHLHEKFSKMAGTACHNITWGGSNNVHQTFCRNKANKRLTQ